jgi:N4-gp56 family major capsid protein
MSEMNVQTTADMPEELRVYYDKNLIEAAKPILVHDQFGQKRPVSKNGGKTIMFRKLAPLAKATDPLTEGVTPDGNSLNFTTIESTLKQYGDYITLSDMVELTSVDSTLVDAGKVLAVQAAETLDAITRDIITAGKVVQYGAGKASRSELVAGQEDGNDYLTVDMIKQAVRTLKRNKAKPINGSYVAIVHPDVVYDLTNDPKWEAVKTYADPKDWYAGEVGRIHGVRFVETFEAKVFKGEDLLPGKRTLTFSSKSSSGEITVAEAFSAEEASALIGRKVQIDGKVYTVSAATAGDTGKFTVSEGLPSTISASTAIYPGEGGKNGCDVYATMILGADAYGVTELEGGGLTNIIKQLGSGGTSDPLDQRATTGWKAIRTAEILVDEFMVRIESTASYQ